MPQGICGWHPSRSPNSWQGFLSLATCPHCRLTSTRSLHNPHSNCWLPPPWPPAGQHHPHLTPIHLSLTPLLLTRDLGVISPLCQPTTISKSVKSLEVSPQTLPRGPNYRPFNERGITGTISKAGSSTVHGSDGFSILHL